VRSRPFGKAANRSLTASNVISSAASSQTFLKTPFSGHASYKCLLRRLRSHEFLVGV
jgi:hypothetical protein